MEENEIGQTYTVDAGQNVLYDGEYAADYEMDESGSVWHLPALVPLWQGSGVCEIDLRPDTGIDAAEPGVCVLKKLPGVDSGMQKIDFLPVGS